MSTSQKTQVIDEKSEQDFGTKSHIDDTKIKTEIESIDLTTKLTNEWMKLKYLNIWNLHIIGSTLSLLVKHIGKLETVSKNVTFTIVQWK